MAKKRLCIDFLSNKNGKLIQACYKEVIETECLGRLITPSIKLDGRHLDPIVMFD